MEVIIEGDVGTNTGLVEVVDGEETDAVVWVSKKKAVMRLQILDQTRKILALCQAIRVQGDLNLSTTWMLHFELWYLVHASKVNTL